jgi:hypothetical protein
MQTPMRSSQRGKSLVSSSLFAIGLATAVISAGCSGGGGGGQGFKISAVNLTNGAVWRINRPIRITFTEPVDFASVNLNTINVRQVGGGPAAGEFYIDSLDPKTVVFQPLCPTRDDLSDAGLKAGTDPNNNDLPYAYELNIIGVDENSGLPVKSASGEALALSDTRNFTTPTSLNPLDLYLDTKVGPPTPRVIGDQADTDTTNGTYIEVGGAAGTRHYFHRIGGSLTLVPPLALPLNKLSDAGTQVQLVIGFNQAVNPSSTNITPARVRWEFQTNTGAWSPLVTSVSLDSNCTRSGAYVRLVPLGLLPPSTNVRAVVTTQFIDLVGESNLLAQNNFAVATDEAFPTNPPTLVDNFLEEFDTSVNEDATAPFAEPHANWDTTTTNLSAQFSFSGTGGPGGDFDWKISTGQTLIFNTSNTTITGGPGFQPTSNETVVGGVVDVSDMWVQAGATLKVEGPNPMVILVSGDLQIDGKIVVNGTSTNGVVTLNTTSVPQPGAPGQAGGGKGGTGSPLTTASSPRGTNGYGAFQLVDAGGGGGETGWSNTADENRRRGAGGGGGRFGKDVPNATTAIGPFDQRMIGLDAEPGFTSAPTDNGAITGAAGPFGGPIGPSPFVDPDQTNDFFGTQFNSLTNQLIIGELKKPWAGAGGGGGGDASQVPSGQFPGPWSPTGDEKGSGGGGGGGSLHILALGNIRFGSAGQIQCRGGMGGGGENTLFLNRVGGGSGGGSGGHVILQSAKSIDMRLSSVATRAVLATGGEGGAGAQDAGGAIQSSGGQIEQPAAQDACPGPGIYATTGLNPCRGLVDGAGGDGGPGVIQLHTATGVVGPPTNPLADIIVPAALTLKDVCQPPPLVPGGAGVDGYMIPTFGKKSRARSKWIALGEGGFDPSSAVYRDVTFDFAGINTVNGFVQTDINGKVLPQPAVLSPGALHAAPALPYVVTPGGYTLVMDATPLIGTANEALLQNVELLRHYMLQLSDASNAADYTRFDVVAPVYDSLTHQLSLTVDGNGPSMSDTSVVPWGVVNVELQPAYFRVHSSGAADTLPISSTIKIQLEATRADVNGNPDPAGIIGPTSDLSVLNVAPNGTLRFVRFQVLFDIDAQGLGLTPGAPIPSLEFFRLPFRY